MTEERRETVSASKPEPKKSSGTTVRVCKGSSVFLQSKDASPKGVKAKEGEVITIPSTLAKKWLKQGLVELEVDDA